MTALVTGATGFIGRKLVRRLRDEGEKVHAMALPGEDTAALDGAEIFVCDITDPESLTTAFRGAQRVYHLAAVVGDWGPEELFWRVNVEGTRNVLDAAVAAGCDRVVMVSSFVVYGSQLLGAEPCHEGMPREYGVGPYSLTKRASEELALDYHEFGRVDVTVVRPGNVFGPESGLWVDEIVANLRAGKVPLVSGGGGDAALAYVDNVVDVMVRAARAPIAAGRIYNALDGSGVTWKQYFTDLAGLIGVEAPSFSLPGPIAALAGAALERAGKIRRREDRPLLTREAAMLLRSRAPVSVRRAEDDLGYRPLVTYPDALERISVYLRE